MDEEREPKREDTGEPDSGEPGQPQSEAGAQPVEKKAEKAEGETPSAQTRPSPPKKPLKKGAAYEEMDGNPLLNRLQENFPEAVLSGQVFLGQPIYTVALDALYEIMVYLRDSPQWGFNYLVDVTALDYLGDPKRFCIVYHLYSYSTGELIRVKAAVGDEKIVPSVSSIWTGADWLEREVYDMFGLEFSGHPDLRRILLPEDWHGHPLRKDYDIKLQDQVWIKKHLRIRKIPS